MEEKMEGQAALLGIHKIPLFLMGKICLLSVLLSFFCLCFCCSVVAIPESVFIKIKSRTAERPAGFHVLRCVRSRDVGDRRCSVVLMGRQGWRSNKLLFSEFPDHQAFRCFWLQIWPFMCGRLTHTIHISQPGSWPQATHNRALGSQRSCCIVCRGTSVVKMMLSLSWDRGPQEEQLLAACFSRILGLLVPLEHNWEVVLPSLP